MVGLSATAYAADATTLATDSTTWTNGDYVVPEGGVTIAGHITVNGSVNLTLTKGTTLGSDTNVPMYFINYVVADYRLIWWNQRLV